MNIERPAGDWLLACDSRIARDIAAQDWSVTSLGPLSSWPTELRTILSTMLACPMPMYLAWGPDLLSFYNDAYEPILGYRAKNALGAPFRDVWSSIWDDIAPLVDGCLRGESQKLVDMRLDLSRQGQPEESFWTFTYSPAFDSRGKIVGLLCVTGETTDRILAERARAKAAERLELALSAGNSVGIWDWDVIENRVTADSYFARFYNVDEQMAKEGAPVEAFFAGIHPEDRDNAKADIDRAIESVGAFSVDYRLQNSTGEIRWVKAQGRCIAGPDGRCVRLPGVCYDITDLKNAELELRAAKEEREFVLDQIDRQRKESDPIKILRESSVALGQRLGVSRVGFYRLIGPNRLRHEASWTDGALAPLSGDEPTDRFGRLADTERRAGRSLIFCDSRNEDGCLPFAQDGVLAGICIPLLTEESWAAGIYLHHAHVRTWTEPEISLAKEIVQQTWLAVERAEALNRLNRRIEKQEAALAHREIVLRREFERREAAERQLRQLQKMEAVGQLTGGIAHDFNNMLAVVISGLNLIQRQIARGNTDVAPFIEGALDGANRAAALTQRLLAFSRQQPLKPVVVNANALMSGLSDMLSRSLGETIRVDIRQAPDLWATRVDPNQLENAIVNLAVNARDAMPDGGCVTLETANVDIDPQKAAELGMDPGSFVRIRVCDTGTGMTPEVLGQAFDPFFTTKPVGRGTGLGLSQVYGFIRQSGGHIAMTSRVGEGTTADLYLPRCAEDVAEMPDDNGAAVQQGRPEDVILVVEDEDRVRAFTIAALRDLGYTVLEAPSGQVALDILANRGDIALLFTDVIMPQMTGPQLAEKALADRPDLKVVYASGYTGKSFEADARIRAGGNFLAKPYNFDQLARKISAALTGAA